MRKHLIPAAVAAVHAARARRALEAGVPLYLPAYDDRLGFVPAVPDRIDEDDIDVDASGVTVGGDEDDDLL